MLRVGNILCAEHSGGKRPGADTRSNADRREKHLNGETNGQRGQRLVT